MSDPYILHNPEELDSQLTSFRETFLAPVSKRFTGLVGFDGFVDTFIRMRQPASMEEFGSKVAEAAGIAASYSVKHQGDKFGGNGPLFAGGLHGLLKDQVDITYVGGVGKDGPDRLFKKALEPVTSSIVSLAPPAHSDCLEFTDGKIMLGDFDACEEITLERLLEVMGEDALDEALKKADFISAVNWGKLPHVGEIWSELPKRLSKLGREAKQVKLFMDLAEFEHRSAEDVEDLLGRLPDMTAQCTTLLSFNLKEAWQLAERLGGDFKGQKKPEEVAELAGFLRERVDVDKLIIHPNSGAACATGDDVVFVAGPFCKEPLISTGAGDHFGAGCLAGELLGLKPAAMLLAGNATSGYFVRSGNSPELSDLVSLVDAWITGHLAERL